MVFFRVVSSLLAALFLSTGCGRLDSVVAPPRIELNDAHIEEPTLSAATVMLDFAVENRGILPLPLHGITYRMQLNRRDFASGVLDPKLTLPPMQITSVKLPLKMPYLSVFQSVAEMVMAGRSAYLLTGTAAIGPVQIPFRAEGTLAMPNPLSIFGPLGGP